MSTLALCLPTWSTTSSLSCGLSFLSCIISSFRLSLPGWPACWQRCSSLLTQVGFSSSSLRPLKRTHGQKIKSLPLTPSAQTVVNPQDPSTPCQALAPDQQNQEKKTLGHQSNVVMPDNLQVSPAASLVHTPGRAAGSSGLRAEQTVSASPQHHRSGPQQAASVPRQQVRSVDGGLPAQGLQQH